jgi:hypothetical protein
MLICSIVDNDVGGFQKMIKYFDRYKSAFCNYEDRSLWYDKEDILKMFFCYACNRSSMMEMVKAIFLEAKNLDINDKFFLYSPLVTAAKTDNFELAEFCLRIGADPFKPHGFTTATPLEIARKKGHGLVARLLKQAEKGRFLGKVKSLFKKFSA